MKKTLASFLLTLALSIATIAQTNPINTEQITMPVFTLNPAPAYGATVATVGTVGNGPQTIYYWVVVNYLVGQSALAGPFVASQAPSTLSVTNYVTVTPQVPIGGLTFDLLKTLTPLQPSGACACAVATAQAPGTIVSDQSNSTSAYTVNPVNLSGLNLTLQNEVQSSNSSHLILRQNGAFVADLSTSAPSSGTVSLTPSTVQTITTSTLGGLNVWQSPCSSLTSYVATDAGCTAIFNSFVLQNIGSSTQNNLRKGLNIYLESDASQGTGANYDGFQVNEAITGNAYTAPNIGQTEAAEFFAQVSGTITINASVAPTNPSGNTWVYTFTSSQPGLVASNGWASDSVLISGYTGGATGNNGVFTVVSSNATTISVTNTTGTATSTGTPLVAVEVGQSNGIKFRNGAVNGAYVLNMIGVLGFNPTFSGGSLVTNYIGFMQDAGSFSGGALVTNWTTINASAPTANVTNSYGIVTSVLVPLVVTSSAAANSFIGHAAAGAAPYTLKDGWYSGTGSPNGVLAAAVGSFYAQQDGAAGGTMWLKATGTGNTGWLTYSTTIAGGIAFTSSGGLDETTLVGGATAGKFTTATVTSGSTVITMGNLATAPHGWHCDASDITHPLDIIIGTSASTTSCTLTVAVAITAGDVIEFSAIGY